MIASRGQEVCGVTPACIGIHVNSLILRLLPLRSCRIAIPSDCENKGKESAHVFMTRPDSWFSHHSSQIINTTNEFIIKVLVPMKLIDKM